MSEWRVTEYVGEFEDASSSPSSSTTEPVFDRFLINRMASERSADLLPRRRRSNMIQINTERLAPLERFIEVGRQLQQSQHLQQLQSMSNQQQRSSNNHLRNKIVFSLNCRYCTAPACMRAMRAILLADTKVELYSTDIPPSHYTITGDEDRLTHGCHCRIRDTICRSCGNVIGYHVSQPCERCLQARNNGHFWMFYSEVVMGTERIDRKTGKPLVWSQLVPMAEDEVEMLIGGYESFNR